MQKNKILLGTFSIIIGISLCSCDHYMSIDNGGHTSRHSRTKHRTHTRSSHASSDPSVSLRGLKRVPVSHYVITSKFGYRYHPITHKRIFHTGVDYATKHGSPIHAMGNGTIVFEGWKNGYGKTIVIKHNRTYSTLYAHMDRYARNVKKGSHVKNNQVIGYVGETGNATGDHVHYEIQKNGKAINPR